MRCDWLNKVLFSADKVIRQKYFQISKRQPSLKDKPISCNFMIKLTPKSDSTWKVDRTFHPLLLLIPSKYLNWNQCWRLTASKPSSLTLGFKISRDVYILFSPTPPRKILYKSFVNFFYMYYLFLNPSLFFENEVFLYLGSVRLYVRQYVITSVRDT